MPYVTCLDLGPERALLTSGFGRALSLDGSAAKAIKERINRTLIVPPIAGGRASLFAAADPLTTARNQPRTGN